MTHALAPQRAGSREWAALGVLTLAVVLLAVDGTVLALAVPALTTDLNPSATQILWIGDIYSFALAGLLITMGNFADRIGRKRLLLIGSAGFGIASVIAAFAPTAEMLIAARALLGISGATLMPSTLSIVRNMFEVPAQRTRAIAIWSAGAGGGAALGPLVGGVLLEHFWWGSVFLINVPIMVILLIAGAILLPESRNPEPTPIDIPSAIASVLMIIPLVYAIKHSISAGFDLPTLIALAVGLGSGIWFVRRQRRLPVPLLDVALFKVPAFAGAVGANTMAIFAFSGLLFFFSQYLQLVRGFSPLQAGLAELPMTIASIVVIVIIGAMVARLGQGPAIGIGLIAGAGGLGILAVAEGVPGYLWLGVALVVIGLGFGIAWTLATDAVVTAVPKERAGAASSISETSYELGIALGIAVLGSLQTLFYRFNLDLPSDTPPRVRDTITESLASAAHDLTGSDPSSLELLEHAQHAFTVAMQATAVAAAVLTLIAGIIAWRVIPASGISTRARGGDRRKTEEAR